MAFWSRKPPPKPELVAKADSARAGGKRRKAIGLYQQALAAYGDDAAIHGKLAPLLAKARRRTEALASFTTAAEGQTKAGFADRAISLYVQAAEFFPDEAPLWEHIAGLHVERGRKADAFQALVRGGEGFEKRKPEQAAKLLQQAFDIEPWHPRATMALGRSLWRAGDHKEAMFLLDRFAAKLRGAQLRRVRALQFRLSPTFGALWRWLRAVFAGR